MSFISLNTLINKRRNKTIFLVSPFHIKVLLVLLKFTIFAYNY